MRLCNIFADVAPALEDSNRHSGEGRSEEVERKAVEVRQTEYASDEA